VKQEKLLIYDGGCAYCRAFTSVLKRLDRRRLFKMWDYDSSPAGRILRAQFGENYGFSMYLFEFDAEEVSWGAEAARCIVETLSLPRWTAKLAFYIYPSLVRLISILMRRTRSVCGPECAGLGDRSQKQMQQRLNLRPDALQELERLRRHIGEAR